MFYAGDLLDIFIVKKCKNGNKREISICSLEYLITKITFFKFCEAFGLKMFDLPFPAHNYMFKAKNRNSRTRFEICSKLTMKTPDTINFENS